MVLGRDVYLHNRLIFRFGLRRPDILQLLAKAGLPHHLFRSWLHSLCHLGRRLGRTESCRRDCHSHFLPKSFAGAYRWPRCHVLVRDVAAA